MKGNTARSKKQTCNRDRREKNNGNFNKPIAKQAPRPGAPKAKYCDESMREQSDNVLNSMWKMWIHENGGSDWSINSYKDGPEIKTVEELAETLHDLESFDFCTYQIFVMRNGIIPVWEDVNNQKGSIVSMCVESKGVMTAFCASMFKATLILISNECFAQNNIVVNGVCLCLKHNGPLIKVWLKNKDQKDEFVKNIHPKFLEHIDKKRDGTPSILVKDITRDS